MRQFTLYNALGEKYDLNNLKSFMQNPSDLGLKRKVKYERIGNTYVATDEELEQKKPGGVICFENYDEYFAFAQFASKRPLVLEYTSAGKFRIDVTVVELDKTELEEGGLNCKIVMESTSTYYKELVLETTEEVAGKVYSYTYPYTYNDFLSGIIEVESDSVVDSPTKITIWGPCINPAWAHYVNGNLVGRGKINIEVSEGRKLVINTRCSPWFIGEYSNMDNTLIADRYEDSDFSTKRFVNLKYGKNKLVFSHEGTGEMKVKVEAAILYEAV